MARLVPDATHFVSSSTCELPGGCTRAAVIGGIAHVLWRYDVLRTLFTGTEQDLRQVVQGSGRMAVPVYRASGGEAGEIAGQIASELAGRPFENDREWPARFAIVEDGDVPAYVVMATDRLAFDGHGVAAVEEDMVKACLGDADTSLPQWQPLDEAAYEQSPEGQAQNERALGYWRTTLQQAPGSLFDFPVFPAGPMRYCHLQVKSAGMTHAMRMLRRSSRLSASSLIISAAAVVLGQYSGHQEIVMRMVAGNRLGRARKNMVATLTSEGVFLLNLAGLPFSQIARNAFRASGSANQFAFCDPAAVETAWADLRLRRGAYLDLGICFSDVQGGFADPRAEPPEVDDLDEAELRKLAELTTVTDSYTPAGILGMRMFLVAWDRGDIMLQLSCDTQYVPAEAGRELLLGIERLLMAAACRDLTAAEFSQVTGVKPVSRGEDWMRFGSDWVDVAAAGRLWRKVVGAGQSAVVWDQAPDGERRLVGYVAGEQPPGFTALHRAFVAALGERSDVRAPDCYRHVARPPADPDRPASWLEALVLAEHSGRADS
jgi:hypothetical protein